MIKGLILSLQFFSRIPIPLAIDFNKKNIRYSLFFLPLVGAIVGGIGGGVFYLLAPYSIPLASFMALLATIVTTGGLHLDGLADTFDGFLSNRDKDQTLEIMEDSRVGAFGVLSLILVILFKFILISTIKRPVLSLILSFANSRLVASYIIAFKKPAKSKGLGYLFNQSSPKPFVIVSIFLYSSIIILLEIRNIVPLMITFLFGLYMSHVSKQKIDGLTGDVYGAIIEIGDAISLLGFWGIYLWI